jgi:L-ascorbate metabolism protein UlaG (beta-lactamase superfamily)
MGCRFFIGTIEKGLDAHENIDGGGGAADNSAGEESTKELSMRLLCPALRPAWLSFLVGALALVATPSLAQTNAPAQGHLPSECLAMAQSIPHATYVRLDADDANARPSLLRTAAARGEVTFTYIGHATYQIETPGGVTIATDYSGEYREKLPDIATMNHAHTSHYTLNPDPRIAHVLHGWGDNGQPAHYELMVGDVLIRNVTSDIRAGFGFSFGPETPMIKDGNSIFIFEVAGLCIGHLGHLDQPLTDSHYAAIGRLDVVMVPIDGGLTLSLDGMSEITKRLRSSIVLPMHRFGMPISAFAARMKGQFEVDMRDSRSFSVSRDTLPEQPTIVVLQGV